ncbi:MAG: hypothetical protein DHS20C19_27040 [Acidimicrobiales bacterium]|nr:MAG: hypothetical protein DHS20C19_27040 [Acidimicrobiales bacterium]
MSRRLLATLAVLSLFAAACGGGGSDEPETSSTAASGPSDPTGDESSTTTASTTLPAGPPTTRGPAPDLVVQPLGALGAMTVLSGEPAYRGVLGQVDPDRNIVAAAALPPAAADTGIAPLTGLPLDDPSVAARPAIVVKIDNTSKGRPQEALAQADLVYEEMIEGGFTRLAAVYHTHAPLLGPIRSGRTTDIAILGSLNSPVFAWSGANLVHAALLRRQDMIDLGAQSRSEYFRAADRPGTYDLMIEAETLHEIAAGRDGAAPPLPHFEYRNAEVGLPETAEPATSVTVSFPSVTARWDWDPTLEGWARTQGGTDHVDAQGERVVAANVVVAEVRDVATGSVDTAGSTVFEQQFLGSGRGWVFTDGHLVEVTWTKPSIRSVATWTTADGIPVALTPGTTWIELAREGTTTVS